MKTFKWNWLITLFVAAVSLGLSSCGDDLEDTNVKSDSDPAGTIVVNMDNDNKEVDIKMGTYTRTHKETGESETSDIVSELRMNRENNFTTSSYYCTEIVSVGQVGGLGKINSIPSTGWTNKTAVVPGCGYIIRFKSNPNYDYYYFRPNYYTYTPREIVRYARVYVVDFYEAVTGGIIGATIKYQENWKNEDKN